jgi:ubiquinone/menaquinone biosynthesis C-methylase UbiE
MRRTEAEISATEQFNHSYSRATSTVIQSIERSVCGCDYGGTSHTTRSEAQSIAAMLSLGPDKTFLEIGAGSGWPSLYLTKETQCRSVLVDLPFEGLRVAKERAQADGLKDHCFAAQADGALLPLKSAIFDAISHSDVLCCLNDKLGVLRECRRVASPKARMAFTTIFIRPDLVSQDYADAVAAGPQFVETETDYAAMLKAAGWRLSQQTDLTAGFIVQMRRLVEARDRHADELTDLVGEAEGREMVEVVRRKMPAIERGLLERAMFVVEPV